MAGRKTNAAYDLYGFIHKVDNGKHSAICTSCNRVLQNTAAIRLQKHRNSCAAARASSTPYYPNLEIKRHVTPTIESMQQIENVNSNVKTEQNNMEFEDSSAGNIYEDAIDVQEIRTCTPLLPTVSPDQKKWLQKTCLTEKCYKNNPASHQPKRHRKTVMHDEIIRNASDLGKSAEFFTNTSQQDENPTLQQQQQQQTEPFESYTATSAVDIDNATEEDDDEDLINIEEELDVIQNLMPRSKESLQLQDELSRAEAEYYRIKAAYFAKLTENSKIKRTLMLLQSRKLQLEIEKLTSET